MPTVEELRAAHPEWNVVQVVDAPGGGQLAVGADGGVFALGGASYRGSYTGLAPEQRQGTRSFTGITADRAGGYTLRASDNASYNFPAAPAAATTTATAPPAGTIDANGPAAQSAKGLIASTLTAVGLPAGLADSLWTENYLGQGRPIQTIIDVDIPASDAFRAKFPAFGHFQAQTGGTVKDYMGLTDSYAGALKAAGLPATFYDSPDDYAKWINGNVSPKEVSDRITLAKEAALTAPPAVHDYLINQEGLDVNNLAAFFLDPDKGSLVKQQAVMTRAQISGAAQAAGFGSLTRAQAGAVQEQGTTGDQATQRFSQIAPLNPLFAGKTLEEERTGGGVGTKEALGFVAGQGADEAAIAAARAKRAAGFEGGGGAGQTGGRGGTGLGSSGT